MKKLFITNQFNMPNEKRMPVLCALACSGVNAYGVFCRIHNREKMRVLLKGGGLHAVDCGVLYLYPRRENYHTLRMSNLIRFKVGCADYRAHPDRIASAEPGARMLLLLLKAFRCILVCVQYVKELFVGS